MYVARRAHAACGWRWTTMPRNSMRGRTVPPSTTRPWIRSQSIRCWRMTTHSQRTEKLMSDNYLKNVIEAALLAAARPVSVPELLQMFDEQSRPTPKEMRALLESLTADYEGRGVTIRETANGFRFQVRSEFSQEV